MTFLIRWYRRRQARRAVETRLDAYRWILSQEA